jgi:cyclophilin family peptidyl-prolyl cis-trans isomerase
MSDKKETSKRKRSRPLESKKPIKNPMFIIVLIIIFLVIISAVYYIFIMNDEEQDNPIAVIDTSLGVFKVELNQDKMPITCNNFIKLVNDGFYDGMIFYRILDDFMIQTGRFFADGSEDFSEYGNIVFEESDLKHVDGTISMASTGVKVGGSSEFFICDGEQSLLDGSYAAFGVLLLKALM